MGQPAPVAAKGDETGMDTSVQLQLKQVLGAIIFAARQPMTTGAIRKLLQETAQAYGEEATAFGALKDADITKCLQVMKTECETNALGFHLVENAEGFRFQSDPAGGPWVRQMLDIGKPTKLSRPAIETLAIIAYRQPISRAEIEGVRGVAVDHVIRMLMEMQLIRIVGRSELPGRPMLYGTSGMFLDHFGLKNVKDLPGIQELARLDAARQKPAETPTAAPAEPAPAESTAAAAETPAPTVESAATEAPAESEEPPEPAEPASPAESDADEAPDAEPDDEEEFDEDEDSDDDDDDEDSDEDEESGEDEPTKE